MKIISYKIVHFLFVSLTSCFGMEQLTGDYRARLIDYNAQPVEVSQYSQHTEKLDDLIWDPNRVSKVRATREQQKAILKVPMAKALIHMGVQHYKHAQFVGVEKSNWRYGHFRILSQTWELSNLLVDYITNINGIALVDKDILMGNWNNFGDIERYGSINADMFFDWFHDMLVEHYVGFDAIYQYKNQVIVQPRLLEIDSLSNKERPDMESFDSDCFLKSLDKPESILYVVENVKQNANTTAKYAETPGDVDDTASVRTTPPADRLDDDAFDDDISVICASSECASSEDDFSLMNKSGAFSYSDGFVDLEDDSEDEGESDQEDDVDDWMLT